MKRRYVIAAGIVAACIGLVLGVLITTLSGPEVTKATLDRIRHGMTMDEVQAVIGQPPTHQWGFQINSCRTTLASWHNPDGSCLSVDVDDDAGVADKTRTESTETIGEKLRRWVRWPWW